MNRSSPDGADAAPAVAEYFAELAEVAARASRELAAETAAIATLVIAAFEGGRKIMFCGNGGSAADAQHLATEYVVRFRAGAARRALPAIALTTDTSLLTAAGNDLGFEQLFARQVEALGQPGDLLFLHSTSGASSNLLEAARTARARGVLCIGMLAGEGGALRELVDHALLVPTTNGAHAQELHLAAGHAICDQVERHFRTVS